MIDAKILNWLNQLNEVRGRGPKSFECGVRNAEWCRRDPSARGYDATSAGALRDRTGGTPVPLRAPRRPFSSRFELMRVNPSAYDYFFIFMEANQRPGEPGAVCIQKQANGLGQRAGARHCKETIDSVPVCPTESDQIRVDPTCPHALLLAAHDGAQGSAFVQKLRRDKVTRTWSVFFPGASVSGRD